MQKQDNSKIDIKLLSKPDRKDYRILMDLTRVFQDRTPDKLGLTTGDYRFALSENRDSLREDIKLRAIPIFSKKSIHDAIIPYNNPTFPWLYESIHGRMNRDAINYHLKWLCKSKDKLLEKTIIPKGEKNEGTYYRVPKAVMRKIDFGMERQLLRERIEKIPDKYLIEARIKITELLIHARKHKIKKSKYVSWNDVPPEKVVPKQGEIKATVQILKDDVKALRKSGIHIHHVKQHKEKEKDE